MSETHWRIRPPTPDDVSGIVWLIAQNARKGGLLPRDEGNIREHLSDFLVAEWTSSGEGGAPEVVGCGSLVPMNSTLVELRSLAVDERLRGQGVGQALVAALVEEARRRKFGTIFDTVSAATRAVTNLLDNAVKYGKRARAAIRSAPQAIEITIEDEGPGIEREHLPRLGERFYRADQSRGGKITGTGLGLAIVKHIMAHHRGGLAVETRLTEGTAFAIWMPAGRE